MRVDTLGAELSDLLGAEGIKTERLIGWPVRPAQRI